jgi:tryptophan synthase alpha chain
MFEQLGRRGEAAFGGFLMLGDPGLEASAAMLDALVQGGADMIEVGIPFSDPVADGPVIQSAALRARRAGIRVDDCFGLIASFRAKHPDVPIGILTYANLIMSRTGFMRDVSESGADSLLIADVPALEAEPYVREMHQSGVEPVLIAAANTPDATIASIARLSVAYTYCVSRAGVTGMHANAQFDAPLLQRLKTANSPPPVFGFGISEPEHVRAAISAGAAGLICGSAFVRLANESRSPATVCGFVKRMKAATICRT